MDVTEIKQGVDALGTAFEEFKKTNDQRIKDEVKGSVDTLIEAKLQDLNTFMGTTKEQMDKLHAAVTRSTAAEEKKSDAETKQAEYKQAFVKYLRKGDTAQLEEKALSVGSDPDGGYLVTPEMGNIINTRVFETSPIRQLATVQTISSDAMEFPIDNDEFAASWVSETGSRSATNTQTFDFKNIPTHEMSAMPKASQKLLDDANINVEQMIGEKISDAFARKEATGFVSGTGVGQPTGLLTNTTTSTSYSATAAQTVNSGTSGAVTADSLITLVYTLKTAYRGGASFLMARGTMDDVRKLKDGNGQYLWAPGLAAGQPDRLLGYPVVEANDMPAVAADSLSVLFGNIRTAYLVVDRIGIRTLRDPFSSKPFVLFYTTKRVGGDVVNYEAFKILKLSS